jgi:hypothetical protein
MVCYIYSWGSSWTLRYMKTNNMIHHLDCPFSEVYPTRFSLVFLQ